MAKNTLITIVSVIFGIIAFLIMGGYSVIIYLVSNIVIFLIFVIVSGIFKKQITGADIPFSDISTILPLIFISFSVSISVGCVSYLLISYIFNKEALTK